MKKKETYFQYLIRSWNKKSIIKFRKSYIASYERIHKENYLGNFKFKYNCLDIDNALFEYVSNIKLSDVEKFIK